MGNLESLLDLMGEKTEEVSPQYLKYVNGDGYEIIRNFNIRATYNYETVIENNHYLRLILTLEDF